MNATTLFRRFIRTSHLLSGVLAALLAGSAGAQTVAISADPVNTTFGGASAANGNSLNIGVTFHVSGPGIEVFQLGAFDWQGDGLASSHVVTLFQNETAIASVTVPAGTTAPLMNGYRFAPLAAPVYLAAGTYSVVSFLMNSNDPYGENNAESFNGSADLSSGDGIFQFTTTGSPLYPNNIANGYDFVSASFTYTNVTAGSSTWTGLGASDNWSVAGNWNTAPASPANLTFAGSTGLASTNDLTGFVADGITFDSAAGAFVLGGNGITLAGSIGFNGNPATPITQTVNVNLGMTGIQSINTPTNGNLTLDGNIISGNDVAKVGAGTLTMGGTNMIEDLDVNGGTNIITGATTVNGNGGIGTGNYDRIYVGDGDTIANCTGTVVIQPGATLAVSGNFNDALVIGRDSGSGKVIQNGGTFSFGPANQTLFIVGAANSTKTRAEYDMNGGVFDLQGNKLAVGLGSGVLVTGVVSQVSGVITNVGDLDLGTLTPNGYGEYDLTGGTIYVGTGGITTYNGIYAVNLGGGTVAASASWSSSLNMTLTGSNGPVTFNAGGNDITLSGMLSGNGGLTVAGSGTLELSGANTYKGDTLVGAGSTLQLDASGSSVGKFRLANGATLNLNFGGNYAVAGFYTNGVALGVGTYNSGNLPGFIAGSGSLQVASSISTGLWTGLGADSNWSTAGNWDQNAVPIFPIGLTFAGDNQLTNNNDLSGLTVSSLTFDSAAGSFTLDGDDITLNGGIGFNGSPATPVTQTVNLNMVWNSDKTFDVPTNGNLTLGGNITTFANNLTKVDAGTLTLGGNDSFAGFAGNGGTVAITGGTTFGGTGGSVFYLGNGNTNYDGTLVIQPGANLEITGSFGDAGVIGRNGGSGTVIQNGGTFTFSPANQSYLFVGATSESGTAAAYDMNGGTLDMGGDTLGIALGDGGVSYTAYLNQTGGDIVDLFKLDLGAVRSYGIGVFNLAGGSITVDLGGIVSDDGFYAVNLGGGTIAASSSWSSPLNMNLTNLNGSVTFDPQGNTITLTGVLSGSGGLTVANSGVLELSGANTYIGDTIVSAGGTLQLDANGSIPSTFRLANGALLNLNNSGDYVVSACYTNGVALAEGTYNSANLPDFIIGSGSLQVAGAISSGLWTGLGANNNWSTAGNWDHNAEPVFPIGLTFAGNGRLINTNDLAGITVSSITFDSAAGAFGLNGNDITLNGSIGFNGSPAAPITQTVNLNMAWGADKTINAPLNGNLALDGNITSGNNFTKTGSGGLILGGVDAFENMDFNGGTNTITGDTTVNGNGVGYDRLYIADGDAVANCNSTLVIQPGATFSVTGNYNDAMVLGRDSGSGRVIQNGGTFSFNPANQTYLFIGASGSTATRAEYDMNGGLLDMNGKTLGIALGVNVLITGVVNQVSGVITNVGNLWLDSAFSTGYSIYNLSGGSLYIGSGGITVFSGGSYQINLGGGMIGAEASWSSALNMTLTGSNGPVTFNPAGNVITLSGALSGSGGLTVAGGGTLELSHGDSYTGATTVSAGLLKLDAGGTGSSAIYLANGAALNLNYSGSLTVPAAYTNGVALAGGVYNSANLPGYITGTGSLTIASAAPPVVNHPVYSGGNLVLTGSGGTAGGGYTWLTTTNLAAPLATWTTNMTGIFDGNGNFSNAIPINVSTPAKFFELRTP